MALLIPSYDYIYFEKFSLAAPFSFGDYNLFIAGWLRYSVSLRVLCAASLLMKGLKALINGFSVQHRLSWRCFSKYLI